MYNRFSFFIPSFIICICLTIVSLHVPQIHTCGPGPLDEVARGAQRAGLATSQREAGLGRWHHRVHRATGRSRVRDMTERRRGERGSDCLTPSELFGQEVLEATWVCLRRHTFIKSSRADPVPAFSPLLASRHLPEESHPLPYTCCLWWFFLRLRTQSVSYSCFLFMFIQTPGTSFNLFTRLYISMSLQCM